jgi:hypothetical protein
MLSCDLETFRAMVGTLPVGGVEGVQNTVREIIANNAGACTTLRNEPQKLEALGLDVRAVA